MSEHPIITFTSDFGTDEHYVAAVKGSILTVNPEARIIDVSHEIPSHDPMQAAFTISCVYAYFPARTIHLVVVDPEVGSGRRGLIAATSSYYFIAPDNGILSLIFAREKIVTTVAIESEHFFREVVSPTFHGRDIFGPVAGWLSRGFDIKRFGPSVSDPVRLSVPAIERTDPTYLKGCVLHVDRFGNITTSFRPKDLTPNFLEPGDHFVINGQRVDRFVRYYAEGPQEGVFSLVGSSGYFEIAAFRNSAARILRVRPGNDVFLQRV